MCAEALCLRANEFAFDTSWYPKAHIQPVFYSLGEHLFLVLLILLWSEQFASIIITHDPERDKPPLNTIKILIDMTYNKKKG